MSDHQSRDDMNVGYLNVRTDCILMYWKMDTFKSISQCEKKMISIFENRSFVKWNRNELVGDTHRFSNLFPYEASPLSF
jgi:hypothetical protein